MHCVAVKTAINSVDLSTEACELLFEISDIAFEFDDADYSSEVYEIALCHEVVTHKFVKFLNFCFLLGHQWIIDGTLRFATTSLIQRKKEPKWSTILAWMELKYMLYLSTMYNHPNLVEIAL